MKIKYYLFAALLCLLLHSCVVLSPQKYKALVAERDSLGTLDGRLQDTIAKLRADTMRLHREIADLQGTYNALNNNFNASSSKVSQLSTDLQKREARLKEVEDALHKRDEATNALKDKLQQA